MFKPAPPRRVPNASARSDTPWDETQRRVDELHSAKTQLLSRIARIERMVQMELLTTLFQLALLIVILFAVLTLSGCGSLIVNEDNLQTRHNTQLVYAYKTAFGQERKANIRAELERRGMNARDFRLLHEGKIGTGMHIDMARGVLPFRRIGSGRVFCARGAFSSTCARVDGDNRITRWVN